MTEARTPTARQPHELLDDGFAPEPCELLVIGCGNILRGDDAVGPMLVRHLHTRGVPDGVRIVDGGTSGMDVAFGMRGAARVVIVDAASAGAAPGTVYRVPADQLADLPPIDGLHTHNFRWDHALSFSSWLLGPLRPTDITVYLVEAGQLDPGAPLSEPVAAGMESVIDLILRDHYPVPADVMVEITEAGYLHLPAALAAQRFPADVCLARLTGDDLVLVPLIGAEHGGLVLKQYTGAGDRSLLISEVCAFAPVAGTFPVVWDDERGALRVLLGRGVDVATGVDPARGVDSAGGAGGDRDPDRGRGGGRAVGGQPARAHAGGSRTPAAADLPHAVQGGAGGRRDPARSGPAPSSAGGVR